MFQTKFPKKKHAEKKLNKVHRRVNTHPARSIKEHYQCYKVDWYNSNNVQYYQDAVIVDVDHDMNL